MYSLLMLLCVLVFHANLLFFENEKPTRTRKWYLVLSELGVAYSHVAGWFFLGFVWLYTFTQTRDCPRARKNWLRTRIWVGVLGALALHFPLAQGSMGHMRKPAFSDVLQVLAYQLTGVASGSGFWLVLAASSMVLLMVVLLLRPQRKTVWFTSIFLIGPLLLAFVISYLVKPMWHSQRTFAFFIPLVAVAVGVAFFQPAANRVMSVLSRLLVGLILVVMVHGTIRQVARFQKSGLYAPVAQFLNDNAKPQETVFVDGVREAMSLKWYFLSPDWDQNMRQEIFSDWPETCAGFEALKCLTQRLRLYDRSVQGKGPFVQVVEGDRVPHYTKGADIVWTLIRKTNRIQPVLKLLKLSSSSQETYKISKLHLIRTDLSQTHSTQ